MTNGVRALELGQGADRLQAAEYHRCAVLAGVRRHRKYLPFGLRAIRDFDTGAVLQSVSSSPFCDPEAHHSLPARHSGSITLRSKNYWTHDAAWFARAAVELDPSCIQFRITEASTLLHSSQHSTALSLLVALLDLPLRPIERSQVYANCAAAAERMGELNDARSFAYRAVSQAKVASLAIYNYSGLREREGRGESLDHWFGPSRADD